MTIYFLMKNLAFNNISPEHFDNIQDKSFLSSLKEDLENSVIEFINQTKKKIDKNILSKMDEKTFQFIMEDFQIQTL